MDHENTDERLIGILTRDVAMSARVHGGTVPPRRVAAGTEVVVDEVGQDGYAVVRLPGTRYQQRVPLHGTVRPA